MPDPFYLLSRWWKPVFLVVLLSLIIVATVLYLRPTRYLSVATAIPASSYSTDKASIFNNSVQLLYSSVGTAEDLDMIVGTGQLDTAYLAVAEDMNLPDHYKTEEQGPPAIRKAAYLLKANTKVFKSEFNELKVKVRDKDNQLAAILANAVINKLQAMHQDLQNSNNVSLLKSLQSGREKIQVQVDSINRFLQHPDITSANAENYTAERTTLSESLHQYEKLIGQYQLMVDSKPPVLIIVERARPTDWPDKPETLPILAGTFVISLLFSLVLALFLEKRKTAR